MIEGLQPTMDLRKGIQMKLLIVSTLIGLLPLVCSAKNQMSPEHSKYLYKTLAKYTQQTGSIKLDTFACRGNGFKICSYSPSKNTAGSFAWVPTTIALTLLLENYIPPYQQHGVWVWEIRDLECSAQVCRFN